MTTKLKVGQIAYILRVEEGGSYRNKIKQGGLEIVPVIIERISAHQTKDGDCETVNYKLANAEKAENDIRHEVEQKIERSLPQDIKQKKEFLDIRENLVDHITEKIAEDNEKLQGEDLVKNVYADKKELEKAFKEVLSNTFGK